MSQILKTLNRFGEPEEVRQRLARHARYLMTAKEKGTLADALSQTFQDGKE